MTTRPARRSARRAPLLEPTLATLIATGMTPEQAVRWSAETDDLRRSCGCEVGAWFMGAALVLYPALWYWRLRPLLGSPVAAVLVGLAVLFVAAGAGKLTGLLIARTKYRSRLRQIRQRLEASACHA